MMSTVEQAGPVALSRSRERPAMTSNGYVMLLAGLVAIAAIVFGLIELIATGGEQIDLAGEAVSGGNIGLGITFVVAGAIAFGLICPGFYLLQPNQAAAILLFGAYRGTDRNPGLRWVLPWLTRQKISTRIHNLTSDRLKVNDQRGNPIEIAANVVWRVTDTAQALYDVDNYLEFVEIQIESAVRAIAGKYPYDDIEHKEVTLRGDAEAVAEDLERELQERVGRAGITVDEARLTHLAYAAEIAQAMLRRQQAEAVIAARQKLVTGAVSMVETALQMLSEKQVVELDDERKAAMVSNLMVVLCGERDTQPVVNAGSLYQ
ncbi:SPFH domain-containing protein [Sphingosinicella sp. LHD-64]|uniref:SPFH domain-containing protein n=1 Tax=Sphingosinicella sp. LHD-64 TaxID=3072139 RepID=UPI00280FC7A3|nr:SPFH domain-containing protein [Sphingosinicella sp. LHD-64]MDQ8758031.1 SPFH domain-containing protein [Sphingosinicella sp. LHD-64]